MDHLSDSNNNSGRSKTSINCICILPSSRHSQTSNREVVPMLSPPHTPKKIMKKISKAIISLVFFKTKKQEELSPPYHSKKIMKKIDKASQYLCLKMKQQHQPAEDEQCLWKKTILMGEKCKPLQFPGAIFYDSKGNQLSEPPRSPRASSDSFSTFAPN